MLDIYGTRHTSWYAKQAPDYLDTEEDQEEADRLESELARADFLYHERKERGNARQ